MSHLFRALPDLVNNSGQFPFQKFAKRDDLSGKVLMQATKHDGGRKRDLTSNTTEEEIMFGGKLIGATAGLFLGGLVSVQCAYAQLDVGGISVDVGCGSIGVSVGDMASADIGGGGASVSVGGTGIGAGVPGIGNSIDLGGAGTLAYNSGVGNGGGTNISLRSNSNTPQSSSITTNISIRNSMISAFTNLQVAEQMRYRRGCKAVMKRPSRFEAELVQFCAVVRTAN